ncbi:GRIN2-like protein [Misgurnus anguillicaudatus]|uniref:GRIN2-like protein n=1 Tax=Misgurnus anguillicaudatus TaxID=75329 RepID=UPI003CCF4861
MAELFPPGDAIPSKPAESIVSNLTSVSLHQPEKLQNNSTEVPSSLKDLNGSGTTTAQSSPTISDQQYTSHHCVTETHLSDVVDLQPRDVKSHQYKQASLTVHRDHDLKEHNLLSIQRSHSDSLQIFKEGAAVPYHCETGAPCCLIKEQEACAQSFPSLVCKQAMPLQQSNTVTTSTRTGSNGSGSPTQPAQHAYIQVSPSAQIQSSSEAIPESTCPKFQEAVCCNLHFHHGTVEDTFAAYCHPQPIPAPAQLLPHLVGMEENNRGQVATGNLLALPRLITSVSETGLDTKRLFNCCNLDCTWPSESHTTGIHLQRWKDEGTTKEAGTMTSQKEVRDIGVQVGQDSEEHPQHVFPEVCLLEEMNGSGKPVPKNQKSPVREVKWDAEGMTWEVYGASADPEELGLAIQRHLEIQIKETKGIAAKLSRQNTATSQHSSGSTHRRKRGLLESLRRPGCCSRSTTAVD